MTQAETEHGEHAIERLAHMASWANDDAVRATEHGQRERVIARLADAEAYQAAMHTLTRKRLG